MKKSQLLRSNKVVGGGDEADIKTTGGIAGADGPGDSAFIVRLRGGLEFICREEAECAWKA